MGVLLLPEANVVSTPTGEMVPADGAQLRVADVDPVRSSVSWAPLQPTLSVEPAAIVCVVAAVRLATPGTDAGFINTADAARAHKATETDRKFVRKNRMGGHAPIVQGGLAIVLGPAAGFLDCPFHYRRPTRKKAQEIGDIGAPCICGAPTRFCVIGPILLMHS